MKQKEHNDYYVYLHRRKTDNEVFYVGKGRRYRSQATTGRNRWWRAVVNKHGFTVEFVEKGLSDQSAYDLEVETIKFYRDNGHVLCNLTDGGEGGSGCVRKQPITDGLLMDLNIYIDKLTRNRSKHWKKCNKMAMNVVMQNMLLGGKIYYNRARLGLVEEQNKRSLSNYIISKSIDYLEKLGYLSNVVSKRTDSIKTLSYIIPTEKYKEFMLTTEEKYGKGFDANVYVQHPLDNRMIAVGYVVEL